MNYCSLCILEMNSSAVPAVVQDAKGRWFCDKHAIVHDDDGGSRRLEYPPTIKQHSGKKYVRRTTPPVGCEPGEVDVYAVLEAFAVTCPATQHALKKLLCAGLRGKGDRVKDLTEAIDALQRAIELERSRTS